MRYRGPLNVETWERLREAARQKMMKEGEHTWVVFCGDDVSLVTDDMRRRASHEHTICYWGLTDCGAVAQLVGCCELSARIWRQRAYEGRPVYPSQFIAKISDILQEPLACDFDLFAKMVNDPANWFNLKAEALEVAKEAMTKGEEDRLEVERQAKEDRLKAEANVKMQELLRQAEAQAKAAGITLTVNVVPVAA